jgi:phospholipase/lecithinase/hemolysin
MPSILNFESNINTFDLSALNFFNPLTIGAGNTLNDRSFNQIVVFGDSLSDTGNAFKATGGKFPPAPFFNGRFSNGPLWIEYLAPQLGISQVTNFAVAGATSGRSNVGSSNVGGQQLPGVLDEIDLFANQLAQSRPPGSNTPATANPRALYIVWGGANDFLTLPQDPAAAIQSVRNSINNVVQAITTLANLGAKTIVVPNLPNLGLTPFAVTRNLTTSATLFSTLFNTVLEGTLGNLEANLGIDLVRVDVFSLSQSIAQRPSEFGFTNITTPLFQATQPVNPDAFTFADDFHPTTAVHRLISDAVKRSLSTPTPGKVLATSGKLLTDLVNSSGLRMSIGSLINDLTQNPFAANNLLPLNNRSRSVVFD